MRNKADIESNFFVLDSEILETAHTELYGYCVANYNVLGVNEESVNEQLLTELNPSDYSDGAYVLVQCRDNEIRISQDFNGCFGIYLYQKAGYFAVSNSFVMLVDYLKSKTNLSIDYDFIKAYILSGLTATAYTETMVKEISCLPKNAQVIINKEKRTLMLQYINYQENSVSLASAEGMEILDNWFYKWTNIIRFLKSKTNKINVDLSGGMDSRLVFLLFAKAGINLNEVHIRSTKDNLHTHIEDYEIASKIADSFHCKLNESHSENKKTIPLSLKEFINLTSYVRLCFCTEIYYKTVCQEKTLYAFCGNGGEALRKHWDISPMQFIKDVNRRAKQYDDVDFSDSVNKILKRAFSIAKNKYHIEDEKSAAIIEGFYRETRCRNHFGKAMAENSVCNVNTMAPLLDSELAKITLKNCKTTNRDIIIAVIFQRYCPELLKFKFDSGRSIDSKILRYARELNEKYPFIQNQKKQDVSGYRVLQAERRHELSTYNGFTTLQAKNFLMRCFLSQKSYELFTKYFSNSIFRQAKKYSELHAYHPEAQIIPVLGTVKIIAALIKNGVGEKQKSPADFFDWLAEFSAVETRFADDVFRTARIDLKNVNEINRDSDMSLLLERDSKVILRKPDWFQHNGIGYSIEACKDGKLDFSAICLDEGEFTLVLRSLDIRDAQKKRINVFIDYKKLIINGVEIIGQLTSISHDKFFTYKSPAKKGQAFRIQIEWERHLYSAQEYLDIIKSQLSFSSSV